MARCGATALLVGAALAFGATAGQASTAGPSAVRPDYASCTYNYNGNIYFASGQPVPNNIPYCVNGWEYIGQNDGNFVIYNSSGRAVWASNTDVGLGAPVSYRMQPDGNFVIYNGDTALWSTRTSGNGGAYLCFQVDGNMVIYPWDGGHFTCTGHALWASGT